MGWEGIVASPEFSRVPIRVGREIKPFSTLNPTKAVNRTAKRKFNFIK